jgi:hypothetical protein
MRAEPLDVGPVTPEATRDGRYQRYVATELADDSQRKRALELKGKLVCLERVLKNNGEEYCIDATLQSVTEADGKLILDVFLKILV